jgi:hypothetical protein
MTTMRERIARAMLKVLARLRDGDGAYLRDEDDLKDIAFDGEIDLFEMSDAVLAELRTPTEAMLVAAEEAVPALACFAPKEQSPSYIAWISAIDAAGAE